jgi:MYXO-CTERM domain-containing protein
MTLALVLVLAVFAADGPARAAAWDKPGWTLTFQDEFDGTTTASDDGCGCRLDAGSPGHGVAVPLVLLAVALSVVRRRR